MTLDKLVEDNYHQLNENDLYIWQYILHHKRECQRISIKDLAPMYRILVFYALQKSWGLRGLVN